MYSNENATCGCTGLPGQYLNLINLTASCSQGQNGNSMIRGIPIILYSYYYIVISPVRVKYLSDYPGNN